MQLFDSIDFSFNNDIKDIYHHLNTNLKNFRFDHIASGLQSFTEKLLVKWITNSMTEFKAENLVYSGGISMNVKANLAISKIPEIKKFSTSIFFNSLKNTVSHLGQKYISS